VFTEPVAAVMVAIDTQSEFAREPWSDPLRVKVRQGIHTGAPQLLDGDMLVWTYTERSGSAPSLAGDRSSCLKRLNWHCVTPT
jgi:class 3 adenylate cyclase